MGVNRKSQPVSDASQREEGLVVGLTSAALLLEDAYHHEGEREAPAREREAHLLSDGVHAGVQRLGGARSQHGHHRAFLVVERSDERA